jgi:hypothetical protein
MQPGPVLSKVTPFRLENNTGVHDQALLWYQSSLRCNWKVTMVVAIPIGKDQPRHLHPRSVTRPLSHQYRSPATTDSFLALDRNPKVLIVGFITINTPAKEVRAK